MDKSFVNMRKFLPLPTTKEWGEDRGEGQSKETNAPSLPNPLLDRMEERELLRLRHYQAVPRWVLRGYTHRFEVHSLPSKQNVSECNAEIFQK